jgi:hypothetical protein
MLRSLLMKKPVVPALSDGLDRVIVSCRPIESMFECFADD